MRKETKKGNINGIIWIMLILFTVMFLGIMMAVGTMVITWTFDEAMPTLTSLGMVGPSNMTSIGTTVLTPVNDVVQAFTWLGGLIYIIALIGCIGVAFAFRFTGSKWLMGFFICCMLLLVVASIFISNIYEDFQDDTGEVGEGLREQTALTYLILLSPVVMCVIGFICGIIMFTGEGGEQQV